MSFRTYMRFDSGISGSWRRIRFYTLISRIQLKCTFLQCHGQEEIEQGEFLTSSTSASVSTVRSSKSTVFCFVSPLFSYSRMMPGGKYRSKNRLSFIAPVPKLNQDSKLLALWHLQTSARSPTIPKRRLSTRKFASEYYSPNT